MNHSIRNLQLLMLNVGFANHMADWNWKNVHSPFARLYYVTEGEARVTFKSMRVGQPDKEVTLHPDHMYVIPPFTMHDELCNGNFMHYYAHIYENPESSMQLFDSYSLPIEIKAGEMEIQLFQRLVEINPSMRLQDSNPKTYDNQPTLLHSISRTNKLPLADIMETRGIICVLLSKFFRQATLRLEIADSRIEQCVAWIRRNHNEEINIQKLASMACMSKDHFIRRFKAELGQTPLAYITQRKIEYAELMLITTETTVKEIAFKLGYEDFSYFNRIFRKWVGMTPLEYRNKQGKQKPRLLT